MNFRRAGDVALVALIACTAACGTSASKPTTGTAAADRLQTEYDTTGRLTRLTYDRDGDGKVDAWGYMDGARVVHVEVDENGDGKPDSWEYHSPTAVPGTTAAGVDKTIERVERATQFDGRVTRREYFDAGILTRVEEDTDGDGRNDKWETYVNGALATMALDTQGRGTPDRRMIYGANGALIRIEADTDGSGVFRPVPQAPR